MGNWSVSCFKVKLCLFLSLFKAQPLPAPLAAECPCTILLNYPFGRDCTDPAVLCTLPANSSAPFQVSSRHWGEPCSPGPRAECGKGGSLLNLDQPTGVGHSCDLQSTGEIFVKGQRGFHGGNPTFLDEEHI